MMSAIRYFCLFLQLTDTDVDRFHETQKICCQKLFQSDRIFNMLYHRDYLELVCQLAKEMMLKLTMKCKFKIVPYPTVSFVAVM